MTRVSITNISNLYLSNFVLTLLSQEHKVFFTVDSSIYVMDVLNPSQTKRYPSELPGCDQVHSLSSVSDEPLLLAYCSDRSIYYDTVYGDWTRIQTYSTHGIPYLCPNGNYNVTFFNDTRRSLQFSVANSTIIDNVKLPVAFALRLETQPTLFGQTNNRTLFLCLILLHKPITQWLLTNV